MTVSLSFTKMQACGNDFIVVNDLACQLLGQESSLAKALCNRHLGVGADGLLILRPNPQPNHLQMVFINADGLEGEMCGNGARCVSAYARHHGLCQGDNLTLHTLAGPVQVRFGEQERMRLTLPPPGPMLTGALDLTWRGSRWHFDALDVGPPHVVCLLDTLDELRALDVAALGRLVRGHAAFEPRGCNVNFAVRSGPDELHMRTYERGVEDETLGCGTGACASALVAKQRLGMPDRVRVVTHSGETLVIDTGEGLSLSGHAHWICEGQWWRAPAPRPALGGPA